MAPLAGCPELEPLLDRPLLIAGYVLALRNYIDQRLITAIMNHDRCYRSDKHAWSTSASSASSIVRLLAIELISPRVTSLIQRASSAVLLATATVLLVVLFSARKDSSCVRRVLCRQFL